MADPKETSLLVEGTRSYPKALAALGEFRRLVIETIRSAVVEELPSLAAALDLRLSENELSDWVKLNRFGGFDGKWTCLGVKIEKTEVAGWGLYFSLAWDKGDADVSITLELNDDDVAEAIFSAFKTVSGNVPIKFERREVYINRILAPEEAEQLSDIQRDLIRQFATLSSRAGGVGKFLKKE